MDAGLGHSIFCNLLRAAQPAALGAKHHPPVAGQATGGGWPGCVLLYPGGSDQADDAAQGKLFDQLWEARSCC
jgi:hypothetical protein